jgi:hypothetical protein
MLEGWIDEKAFSMENESIGKSYDELDQEIEGIQ